MSEWFTSSTGPQAEFNANMAALTAYMNATPANNPVASVIKTNFAKWASGLSWYDRQFDTQNLWNRARNYRNDFNTANAGLDPAKRAVVMEVITKGQTSEDAMGEPPAARTSGGRFVVEGPAGSKPLIPTSYKIAAVAAGAGVVTIVALKKLHVI